MILHVHVNYCGTRKMMNVRYWFQTYVRKSKYFLTVLVEIKNAMKS